MITASKIAVACFGGQKRKNGKIWYKWLVLKFKTPLKVFCFLVFFVCIFTHKYKLWPQEVEALENG